MRVIGFFVRLAQIGAVIYLLFALSQWRAVRVVDMNAIVYDPGIEVELAKRSKDFSGIDRWTYPGISLQALTSRLEASGYKCPTIQDQKIGGTPKTGVHPQLCTRHSGFPLPRDLVIRALVDFDRRGRIVAIQAKREDSYGAAPLRAWGRALAAMHLIEPSDMAVTGLSFGKSADLARWVVDVISPNSWYGRCDGGYQSHDYPCQLLIEQLKKEGIPAIPTEPVNPNLLNATWALAGVGIYLPSPVSPDGPVDVTVADEGLWFLASGPDLAGSERRVGLLVDPNDAHPIRLRVQQGSDEAVEIRLNGKPYTNNKEPYWLLPLAEEETAGKAFRQADWIIRPESHDERWLQLLDRKLSRTDPAYMPLVVRGLFERAANVDAADSLASLTPELQRIDQRAFMLRDARILYHVSRNLDMPGVESLYPDDPLVRAAWALARCEKLDSGTAEMDLDCWREQAGNDIAVDQLLRRELNELKRLYAGLDEGNPVRRRLARLEQALDTTP